MKALGRCRRGVQIDRTLDDALKLQSEAQKPRHAQIEHKQQDDKTRALSEALRREGPKSPSREKKSANANAKRASSHRDAPRTANY